MQEMRQIFDRAPKPAWYIACDIGGRGKHLGKTANGAKRKLPNVVVDLLRMVKSWARSGASRTGVMRKTFVLGYSRGAAWGCQLMARFSAYFDGAVLLAPYPSTRCDWDGISEARDMLQAPLPLMLLSFLSDCWCNAARYDAWFTQLELAMATDAGDDPRQRRESFLHVNAHGNHDSAKRIFEKLNFDSIDNGSVEGFWRALFEA